ncbi:MULTISPECIES: photosynthetic complex assembly protein PuhC [unclassified Iodidimonas]|jgi:putative photosynthetic complex assembly protein|uniref:photosynthetic complex assembly protein PuhC n=1 Tax=unclassified Iodidimonas TaxID=2626145 RepID=UPI0024828AEA|nr:MULTISPECIES: photosynthetic complex assembly protein PuhC [unclassified Iodidimonas]
MATHQHGTTERIEHFPRVFLLAAAGLIGLTILTAALSRWTGSYHIAPPEAELISSRSLYFADHESGAVIVTDAATGQEIARLEAGGHGFTRAMMRSLAQERMAHGISAQTPFRLSLWANGRLSLQDPETGRLVDLNAFGPTNAGAFAVLMPSAGSLPNRTAQ